MASKPSLTESETSKMSLSPHREDGNASPSDLRVQLQLLKKRGGRESQSPLRRRATLRSAGTETGGEGDMPHRGEDVSSEEGNTKLPSLPSVAKLGASPGTHSSPDVVGDKLRLLRQKNVRHHRGSEGRVTYPPRDPLPSLLSSASVSSITADAAQQLLFASEESISALQETLSKVERLRRHILASRLPPVVSPKSQPSVAAVAAPSPAASPLHESEQASDAGGDSSLRAALLAVQESARRSESVLKSTIHVITELEQPQAPTVSVESDDMGSGGEEALSPELLPVSPPSWAAPALPLPVAPLPVVPVHAPAAPVHAPAPVPAPLPAAAPHPPTVTALQPLSPLLMEDEVSSPGEDSLSMFPEPVATGAPAASRAKGVLLIEPLDLSEPTDTLTAGKGKGAVAGSPSPPPHAHAVSQSPGRVHATVPVSFISSKLVPASPSTPTLPSVSAFVSGVQLAVGTGIATVPDLKMLHSPSRELGVATPTLGKHASPPHAAMLPFIPPPPIRFSVGEEGDKEGHPPRQDKTSGVEPRPFFWGTELRQAVLSARVNSGRVTPLPGSPGTDAKGLAPHPSLPHAPDFTLQPVDLAKQGNGPSLEESDSTFMVPHGHPNSPLSLQLGDAESARTSTGDVASPTAPPLPSPPLLHPAAAHITPRPPDDHHPLPAAALSVPAPVPGPSPAPAPVAVSVPAAPAPAPASLSADEDEYSEEEEEKDEGHSLPGLMVEGKGVGRVGTPATLAHSPATHTLLPAPTRKTVPVTRNAPKFGDDAFSS